MNRRQGRAILAGFVPDLPDLVAVRAMARASTASIVIGPQSLPSPIIDQHDARHVVLEPAQPMNENPELWNDIACALQSGEQILRWYPDNPLATDSGRLDAAALHESGFQIEVVPVIPPETIGATFAGIPMPGLPRAVDMAGANRACDITIGVELAASRRSPGPLTVIDRPGTPAQSRGTSKATAATPGAISFTGAATTVPAHNWFESLPLFGKRVLVTRTREQAATMSWLLLAQGAEPVELPAIRITPDPCPQRSREAVDRLPEYDWVIFTSANGVDQFMRIIGDQGYDARRFGSARIGAIGNGTAARLRGYFLEADFVPDEFVAEAVLAGLRERGVEGARILIPRAEAARETLPNGLREHGATVDVVPVYRTEPGIPDERILARLAAGEIDIVTFTSSSTVTNLLAMLDEGVNQLRHSTIACIGPITAQTAREHGLHVSIVASEYSVPGLVDAICTAMEEAA